MKYKKVVIWGHPLYSHTHSYVHEAYFKAFQRLGYEAYWFHNNSYPSNFDFNNCLFITEGFADQHIPIKNSSCYCVMYCPNPAKYIEAENFIDIRSAAINFKDHVYEYSLNKLETSNIGPGCYFYAKQNKIIHHKNKYFDQYITDYNVIYISWATNLLPEEIDINTMYMPRQNKIIYCGTISDQGINENLSMFKPFLEECKKNNIAFHHNDPWISPLSSKHVMQLTQSSLLGIDIRGPEHIRTQVIPCRVFKNISYGHLGLTNSEAIRDLMDGNCVFNQDTSQLFYDAMSNRTNFKLIDRGMRYVRENHTYINRINSIISIL